MSNMAMAVDKLAKIRTLFGDPDTQRICSGPLSAYLLPRTDAHQSEYLTARDSRIEFLSGFSGSNAFVIITNKEALLWTDGRYFIQAKSELEPGWTLMEEGVPNSVSPLEWLISNLSPSAIVAFDPQLYSYAEARKLQRNLYLNNITAMPLEPNLVDVIWTNRPVETVKEAIALHASEYGVESTEKVASVRRKLESKKCQAVIFTALDDIAWLLNIRGADVPYNPLVFSTVVVTLNDVHLFVDTKKLNDEVQKHLGDVRIHNYEEATAWIKEWYKEEAKKSRCKIYVPDSTNFAIGSLLKEEHCSFGSSMVQTMKSVKNDVELKGIRCSHVLDSAVIVRFLSWLERQINAGKNVTEIAAAEEICKMRSEVPGFMGPSFETISAVDDHAALPHYRATEESGLREVSRECIYLIDSGGHYRNGTTDVTRTVGFGAQVSDVFKRAFTLVLKGHIDTAQMVFPDSMHGIRIDVIARQHLWKDGLDFGHGVGHGVGHFLNVHEGPAGIGFRRYTPDGVLHKGMIITIEPGYYLENHWGIRIENCYETVKAVSVRSGASNFLTFKSLTYVPIQKSSIQRDLLTESEIEWLNTYHQECLEKIGPLLLQFGRSEEYRWLIDACSPL